jgi:hypothetical protein
MYCRNCGKELIGEPYYCMNCGARPQKGYNHCPACANPTSQYSEICVKCGTGLKESVAAVAPKGARHKSSAVLLAVFLCCCTWLYTYKKDSWKFWVALAVWVFMIMVLAAHIGPLGWLLAAVIWIWSIVDTARRPPAWYRF